MDEEHRNIFKKLLETIGDKIIEETIKENLIQFKLQKGPFYYLITYIDEKPLCEILYPCPFVKEEDIRLLSNLIKEPEFSFEFIKLITVPNIIYSLDLNNDQFRGFSIFAQIYKKSDEISLHELANTILNVTNYGRLAGHFISLKIGKNSVEQKQIFQEQKNLDNPMFS